MNDENARTLIEKAMRDVRIVPCKMCGGWSTLPESPFGPLSCPVCRGSGVTTREVVDA